jgi:hypothetical protein
LPRTPGFVNEGSFNKPRKKVSAKKTSAKNSRRATGGMESEECDAEIILDVKKKRGDCSPLLLSRERTAASILTVLPAEADHSKSR